MSVQIGYITSWRRAMFLTVVFSIIVFGATATLTNAYIGIALIANMISVGALVLCIALFLLVLSDKWDRYSGAGTADIKDGTFIYNDKKRHLKIELKDISKVDMEKITFASSNQASSPMAYRLLIKTSKKKYYIESDRAAGREYNEVDLHNLYIYLQQNI